MGPLQQPKMSQSLYQKYRPQAFADVVGQEPVKESLRNQVMRGKVTHAYLFTGPRGVGKTTLARILARAVNCENPKDGEPDNTCASCKRILDGAALDVIEIDAASHTGVDNVREHVITAARVPPVGLKRKVFIIDEVHMLSTSAFNALLKTLEEPPEHALFIMATTESHKIPMTIVSRCQRFDFKRILLDQMVDRLSRLAQSEGVEVDRAVLERVAAKSEGALRDAETLLGQLFALGETKISEDVAELVLPRSQIQLVLGFFEAVVARRSTDAIGFIDKLVEEGVNILDFVRDEVDFMRRAMLYHIDHNLLRLEYIDLSAEQMKRLDTALGLIARNELVRLVNLFVNRFPVIKSAELPQLPLELTVLLWTEGDMDKPAPQPAAPVRPVPVPSVPVAPPVPAPAPAAPPAATPAVEVAASTDTLSEEAVRQTWTEVMNTIRANNHSIGLMMGVSHLIGVEARTVRLGVRYRFHKDRIKSTKNEEIIRKAMEAAWGRPVMINVAVGDEFAGTPGSVQPDVEEPSPEEVKNVWDLALNVFGDEKKG